MAWFKDLKTVTKLMLGFALVGIITAGVGYLGVSNMGTINGMLETLFTRDVAGLTAIKDAQVQLFTIARDMRQSLLVERAERPAVAQGIDKLEAGVRENLQKFEKTLATADGKAKYAEMEKAFADYVTVMHEIVKLGLAGEDKAAKERLATAASTIRKVVGSLDDLAQTKQKLGVQVYQDSQRLYAASRTMMLGLIAVGVFLGLALGYFIAALIAKGLRQVVEKSGQAAAGDLTVRVALNSQDELGQMGAALNNMLQSFHDSMSEVREASRQTASAAQQLTAVVTDLSSASQQLASGSEQLSSGAQEQASSLEETAASLEEITSTVRQNADNARQANQMAVSARDGAQQGGTIVKQAVASMEAITDSSKQIAAIITTIDEIAFQTNLLALNAAVEAARAGEQGRGFAVVASEVRALAQRSAAASKEIKTLITDSVSKVEGGAKLVNQSGETLVEIVSGSKKVADLIAEITAASQEQSQGIEQVNKAITQMDSVTQQNAAQTEELSSTAQNLAAQTEELSATAQSLAAQADQLQAQVAKFTLTEQGHALAAAPAKPAVHTKVIPLKPKSQKPGKAFPASPKPAAVATGTGDSQGAFEEF